MCESEWYYYVCVCEYQEKLTRMWILRDVHVVLCLYIYGVCVCVFDDLLRIFLWVS